MSWLKRNKNTLLVMLILLVLSIPVIIPLLHSGFFESDDGEWMIIRLSAFHESLRDGQFPVRFLGRLNQGYGYPVANFLYPGFMYFSEVFHALGLGFVNSIKAVLVVSMIGSALFAFLWLSTIFEKTTAAVGALFYLYLPYHLFDLYKRGSVGEIFALLFIPLILWMIERKNIFLISGGIFLLMISHNTLAAFFIPLLFIYAFLRRKISAKNIIFSFIIGILMSSFFTIPAIFELPYTRFSTTQISNITDYFAPIPLVGSISFIVLFSSAILFMFSKYKLLKGNKFSDLLILFVVISVFSIFFSSEASMILWNFIPSSVVQFPFRLLSYLIVALSFLSSYIVSFFTNSKKWIVICILVFVLLLNSSEYLAPSKFFDKGENFYSTNEATTTVQNEYMPIWVKNMPFEHFKNKVELLNGAGQLNNIIYNSNKITFSSAGHDQLKVRINTIYYPGWQAYIDSRAININYKNDNGVMDIIIPPGNHNVKLFFGETSLRLFSDVLSILSFLILLFLTKKIYP